MPPIEDQRRIADILDRADALRAKRREAIAHLDDLAQSIFLDMFGGEARTAVSLRADRTHRSGWQWRILTDVAELATGHTPDRTRSSYWGGDVSWISLPEIRALDGRTAFETELRVTPEGIANSSAVLLPVGTVCFSRTASIGFVTKLGRPMATSQDFHNWIPGPHIDPDYLMAALRISRPHLLGASDGSTHKTIYQRVATQFRVLLPPLALQQQFAQLLKLLNLIRATQSAQLRSLDGLFASLQQRAFAGLL